MQSLSFTPGRAFLSSNSTAVPWTVAEEYQGRGVGRKVLARTIEQGRVMGAKKLYLETNHALANAIHLYESLGFKHLPPADSPYARADVFMEIWL